MKLELVPRPVTDIDRAKAFYVEFEGSGHRVEEHCECSDLERRRPA
jgi:hypothetical protein